MGQGTWAGPLGSSRFGPITLNVCLVAIVVTTASAQTITDQFSGELEVARIGSDILTGSSRITQMTLTDGPSETQRYLYMASNERGIRRVIYDTTTNDLTGKIENIATDVRGLGLAFHGNTLYASEPYQTSAGKAVSRIWRLEDMGTGTRTAIVEGIPRDDHGVDHIVFIGNTLYVGIGTRTRNGAYQTFSGDSFGESAYGGSIAVIDDITQVPSTQNAAGFFPADPSTADYRNLIKGRNPLGASPYTTTDPGKLRIHSTGARNPFGVSKDGDGNIWFTNNFQRVENDVYDRSKLSGTEGDAFGGDGFQDDVHDQFFKAIEKGDYGYRNGNWQDGNIPGNTQATDAGFFQPKNRVKSFTFDNYVDPAVPTDNDHNDPAFNTDYDVDNPTGLGPSSSANGFDFYDGNTFPQKFHKDAFIARWNSSISDGGDLLTYRDVVSVDIDTGDVERIASGFRNPLDVISDGQGNVLVADHSRGVYLISPTTPFTEKHEFHWDSDGAGNWSDRLTWNANGLPENERMVPHAWGGARYHASIGRTNSTVFLDQDATVESLHVSGTLDLTSGNQMTVQDEFSTNSADALILMFDFSKSSGMSVGGVAEIDGFVEVLASEPVSIGDTLVAIDANAVAGTFAQVLKNEIDGQKAFAVTYTENQVSLTVALRGDTNVNGEVDFRDFVTLSNHFNMSGTWADGDFDGNGQVEFRDFNGLSTNFGMTAAQSVPEPTTSLLTLLALLPLLVHNLCRFPLRFCHRGCALSHTGKYGSSGGE